MFLYKGMYYSSMRELVSRIVLHHDVSLVHCPDVVSAIDEIIA